MAKNCFDEAKKYLVNGEVSTKTRLSTILKILNDINVISDESFEIIKENIGISDDYFLNVKSYLDTVFRLILNVESTDDDEMFNIYITDYRLDITQFMTNKGNDAYDRLYHILNVFFDETENMMYEINCIIKYD